MTKELTIEQVREFIYDNDININDLFDRETIVDWVKDNYDIDDLIDIDMRWS